MGNSWTNTAITTLTIPTGATTGARVVIDGTTGFITVYNAANQAVDTIGGPAGAILVSSPGAAQVEIVAGQVEFGTGDIETQFPSVIASTNIGQLTIQSGSNAGLPLNFQAQAVFNQAVNPGGTPTIVISEKAAAAATNLLIGGAVVAADNSGTAYIWQSASAAYGANWSDSNIFSGLGGHTGVEYRRMPDDTVWIYGYAQTAAGAGTTVFTLASGYYDPAASTTGYALRERGGVVAPVALAVDGSNGHVILGAAPAAGDRYSFNVVLPLGNIS